MNREDETRIMARAARATMRLAQALAGLPLSEAAHILLLAAETAEIAVESSTWKLTWQAELHEFDPES